MRSPLTKVLTQVIARGFYKEHSGILLFFFVTVFISCFYVSVLNETHIPKDQRILYALLIPLTFITTPIFALLAFAIWLVYTIKSWQYVSRQLSMPENEFLRYSSTSMSRTTQYESWFILQLLISIPFVAFSIFAVFIGMVFGQYIIPVITLIYILILTAISAFIYLAAVNRMVDPVKIAWMNRLTLSWPKPLVSVSIYHLLQEIPVAYTVSKVVSALTIAVAFYKFDDSIKDNSGWASLVVLTIATIHCIVMYLSYSFEVQSLWFLRNFPYTKFRRLAHQMIFHIFLFLPEIIWILFHFPLLKSVTLLILLLATASFYHGTLYAIKEDMQRYIRLVFFSYITLFICLLFQVTLPVSLILFGVGTALFYRNYYR